jgi:uncharacterized protein (TIGR03118 family)
MLPGWRVMSAWAAAVALAVAGAPGSASASEGGGYLQANLVADQDGVAQLTDPNLVNAWGLAEGPNTPLWVADNHNDVATVYRGGIDGGPVTGPLRTVGIPSGAPTGQVFNDTTGFVLPDGASAAFILDSEAGVVTAWNGQLNPATSAVTVATTPGAIYKGLALLHRHKGAWLLATDFHNARIDVFNSGFQPITLSRHAFTDPKLPMGFAPFGIAVIGDRVFVTYALQDADAEDDVAGAGLGFIDVYRGDGKLLQHFARRGVLNAPWGLTIAPEHFGRFSGDLLVGNFGDGRIHAFDPHSGRLLGTLRDPHGSPIEIDGLWGLLPGNGVAADKDDVWFSAGPGDENHGLLGTLRTHSDND